MKSVLRKISCETTGLPFRERFLSTKILGGRLSYCRNKNKAFYEGELGEAIERCAIENEAALTLNDLKKHENEWCGTISQEFENFSLHEILQTLKVLRL